MHVFDSDITAYPVPYHARPKSFKEATLGTRKKKIINSTLRNDC